MLAAARHRFILERLHADGSVQVAELSERLRVTAKTIREDLVRLEEKGLLRRTHGGAVVRSDDPEPLLPLQIPNVSRLKAKEAIAAWAIRYVEEGDVVALDAGSTTLEIAKRLPNEPITVITNDLLIVRELIAKDRIRLVVPGGYRQRNVLVGTESPERLQRLGVSKLFLSATGVHEKYGLSVFTGELIELKKAYIASAKQVICAADHSKFDRSALLTFAELADIDLFITDAGLDSETARRYEEGGSVRIERAPLV